MEPTSSSNQTQIDNKNNIAQSPQVNSNQTSPPVPANPYNLNKILILVIIILLLVIVAGGGYLYFFNQQQSVPEAEIIPQPQVTPQSLTTPEVTETIADDTIVTKYKTITFKVGVVNGNPVKAQITVPETWTSDETSTPGEGFDEGFERITFTLKAGNNAILTVNNIFEPGGAMPSALPKDAVLITNLTKTYIADSQINASPHAIYRVSIPKTGNYGYVTATKGKYSYLSDTEAIIPADGWYYTQSFYGLDYFKQFDSFQAISPSLSITGPTDEKEEILALFDKVMQSFKVL